MTFVLSILSLISINLFAIDLDVEGAKRKYEAAQREADVAQGVLSDAERKFYYARDEVDRLQSQSKDAEERVKREIARLIQIGENIDHLADNLIPNLKRDIKNLERKLDSAERELNSLNSELSSKEREFDSAEWELRRVNADIAAEEAKAEPNQTVLQNLKRKRNQLNSKIQRLKREISNLNSDIRDTENEIRDLDRKISRKKGELDSAERQIKTYQSDFQYQNGVVERAGQDLTRINRNLELALGTFNQAKGVAASAKAAYDKKAKIARQAYDYWQQVIANYNSEREKVIQLATSEGKADGGLEGRETAIAPGTQAGQLSAEQVGKKRGTEDAQQRDLAFGYVEGRQTGASSGDLVEFYQKGIELGGQLAESKAKKENFPQGYNSTLKQLLAAIPSQVESYDLSQIFPEIPSTGGSYLSDQPQAIGSQPAPQFEYLKEPNYTVPSAMIPSVSVPDKKNTYYNPPCTGLILAEFEPLCREVYATSYQSGFSTQYEAQYEDSFELAFDANIKDAYEAALAVTQPESKQSGRELGAEHAGILDGFAKSLEFEKTNQYQLGVAHFENLVASGYLPLVEKVILEEANEDGLYTPGEKVSLTVVMNNYGKRNTPEKLVRLRIIEADGLLLDEESRQLPGFTADTQTTLINVLTASVGAGLAGQGIAIKGVIEAGSGGAFTKISEFTLEAVSHFPVELQSIDLPKKPGVGEWVDAVFTYKNLTQQSTEEAELEIGVSPKVVDVKNEDLVVPSLASGEAAEVTVPIKPGVWVGGNSYVNFFSQLKGMGGIEKLIQPFKKKIEVDRSGSLEAFDSGNKPLEDSTLVVRPGWARFNVAFKYHRDYTLPGPFIVKKTTKSHDSIGNCNHSTISVNYGSWGPGYSTQNIRFCYTIPQSLSGQRHWVMVQLNEGSKALHALQIFLDVR